LGDFCLALRKTEIVKKALKSTSSDEIRPEESFAKKLSCPCASESRASDPFVKKLLGATLAKYLRVTGEDAMHELPSQSSFYSSNDPRLHFGLGPEKSADIEIRWPRTSG